MSDNQSPLKRGICRQLVNSNGVGQHPRQAVRMSQGRKSFTPSERRDVTRLLNLMDEAEDANLLGPLAIPGAAELLTKT
jgi:hypothetical protein